MTVRAQIVVNGPPNTDGGGLMHARPIRRPYGPTHGGNCAPNGIRQFHKFQQESDFDAVFDVWQMLSLRYTHLVSYRRLRDAPKFSLEAYPSQWSGQQLQEFMGSRGLTGPACKENEKPRVKTISHPRGADYMEDCRRTKDRSDDREGGSGGARGVVERVGAIVERVVTIDASVGVARGGYIAGADGDAVWSRREGVGGLGEVGEGAEAHLVLMEIPATWCRVRGAEVDVRGQASVKARTCKHRAWRCSRRAGVRSLRAEVRPLGTWVGRCSGRKIQRGRRRGRPQRRGWTNLNRQFTSCRSEAKAYLRDLTEVEGSEDGERHGRGAGLDQAALGNVERLEDFS
ncbi:hypothetical protein B0H19DRAFT_1293494 [Mycena capillaripes]|nr:hypothetical protein B0H19DRAFT_1293494 [Mycena capillaripes]